MGNDDLDALMWSRNLMIGIASTLVVGGIVVGVIFLEPEWPLAKRALGGAFLGAGSALILLANRLIRDDDD